MFDIEGFRSAVDHLHSLLETTDEAAAGIQLSTDSWSLKEIVGHLIDSYDSKRGPWESFPPTRASGGYGYNATIR